KPPLQCVITRISGGSMSLNTIFDNHILEADISIYKYNTNIHLFAKHLFQNYSIGNGEVPIDDIDIIQVL
ncbi:MAG: hypothetical protein RSH23_03680, partial [Erysipelotrichaceae bacterium]